MTEPRGFDEKLPAIITGHRQGVLATIAADGRPRDEAQFAAQMIAARRTGWWPPWTAPVTISPAASTAAGWRSAGEVIMVARHRGSKPHRGP